jgi:hypothetical protein
MGYNNYADESTDEKAVWNIDDEILKIIKDLKICFLKSMRDWKLEDAYWYLDLMCMECDAKLKDTEQKEIEDELKSLEKQRKLCKSNSQESAGELYKGMRELYKKLNRLMKSHGVWFREMEDDGGL